MKKNKMMRLASAMMVLTLMTTSVISGTFAKYVTEDSASDKARVAKWGITVQAGGNLFGKYYAKTSDDTIAAASTNVATSLDDNIVDNIVAPGTKNEEGFTIAINGTPEVEYSVKAVVDADLEAANIQAVEEIFLESGEYGVMVQADGLNAATDVTKYYIKSGDDYVAATGSYTSTTYYELHDYVNVTEKYYPITWTIKAEGIDDILEKRLTDIANTMETKLTAKAGTLNVAADCKYNLSWIWKFENTEGYANGADTILGNLQAAAKGTLPSTAAVVKLDGTTYKAVPTDDYNLDVAFGLTVTVTQED